MSGSNSDSPGQVIDAECQSPFRTIAGLTVAKIVSTVAAEFQITEAQMLHTTHERRCVRAKYTAMFLAHRLIVTGNLKPLPITTIGREVGNYHGGIARDAIKRVEHWMSNELWFKQKVAGIANRLRTEQPCIGG